MVASNEIETRSPPVPMVSYSSCLWFFSCHTQVKLYLCRRSEVDIGVGVGFNHRVGAQLQTTMGDTRE